MFNSNNNNQRVQGKNPLDIEEYLKKVIVYDTDVLDDEQELKLIKRIKLHHDRQAFDEFVGHNIRLVISCANQFRSVNQRKLLTLEDLIQEGMFGLFRAIEGFDYKRGFKFSTYAYNWIQQSMQKAIDEHGRTLRVKPSKLAIIKQYKKNESELEDELGHKPIFEQITKNMQWTDETIRESLKLGIEPLSFSQQQSYGSYTGHTLQDEIADTMQDDSNQEQIEHTLLHDELNDLLNQYCLPIEKKCLSMLFGLNNEPQYSIDEIAQKLHINHDQVLVYEHHALQKLRASHECEQFKELVV